MQLTHLKVNNFRVFEQAEFEFKPGMNLIVGINGAGKSSVLDLLRIMLSRSLSKLTKKGFRPLSLVESDYLVASAAITAEIGFTIEDVYDKERLELANFIYTIHKNLENFTSTNRVGDVRSQTINLPDVEALSPLNKDYTNALNAHLQNAVTVFYSTRRSIPTLAKQTKQDDSLLHRDLSLKEFAEWWLVQQQFAENESREQIPDNQKDMDYYYRSHRRSLTLMESVIENFLNGYQNLRAVRDPEATLLVDKGKTTLDVRQLSDGERGVLALAFDLVKRIVNANLYSKKALEEVEAIVLIDEIDLHLHPRWQREIVQKLTATFPKCQFIATTHSPQVVGEVSPENIIILEEGKPPYRPDQSLGMDTNWILEFLMGTTSRNELFQNKLDEISRLIEKKKYKKAQFEIDHIRTNGLDRDPELLKLQTRLERILILGSKKSKNK